MPLYAMDNHPDLDDHDIHGQTLFMFMVLLCETGKLGALKKEIWVLWRASLFLGKWYEVATYFLYKKIRKNNKYDFTWLKCFIVIDLMEINTSLINWILQGFES